jgi:membrane carboxypeptidase/penicillin-binding protein
LWFIGYTPDLVAGAWMGYDDFSSLGRKDWTGGSTVVPWWTQIMGEVLKGTPKRDFPVPPKVTFVQIDSQTGLLALPTCPKKNRILEAFLEGTVPKEYCRVDHSKLQAAPSSVQAPAAVIGPTVEVLGISTAAPVIVPAHPPSEEEPGPDEPEDQSVQE